MNSDSFCIVGASNAKIMAAYLNVKFLKLKNLGKEEVDKFVKLENHRANFPRTVLLFPPTNSLIPDNRYFDKNGKLHTHQTFNMKRPNSREMEYLLIELTRIISVLESEGFKIRLMCNFPRAYKDVCDCPNHIFHHAHRQLTLFKKFESLAKNLVPIFGLTLEFSRFVCNIFNIKQPKVFSDKVIVSIYSKILQIDNLHLNNLGKKVVASYLKERLRLSISDDKCFI